MLLQMHHAHAQTCFTLLSQVRSWGQPIMQLKEGKNGHILHFAKLARFSLFVRAFCFKHVSFTSKKHLRALLLPEGVLNPSLKVAVPLYAQTPTLAVLAPVLEDLSGLLGRQFKSLQLWQGRHDLLATSDASKWHHKPCFAS